ncbi:Hypothetical protein NTJ_12981 [Nesidiocoris tenuis]|nr:Hypothetical protein NTJ_12981 [Nesidiocoris tenuis]
MGHSFILFPDELMSLLNIFYSRIPPVRFGVDNTKVGLGFRMGRNVRVEMMFELGPQNASTPFPPLSSAKREIVPPKLEKPNRQIPSKKKDKKSSKMLEKLRKMREQSTTTKMARKKSTTEMTAAESTTRTTAAESTTKTTTAPPPTTKTTTAPPPTTKSAQNATEMDMRENEIDHTY